MNKALLGAMCGFGIAVLAMVLFQLGNHHFAKSAVERAVKNPNDIDALAEFEKTTRNGNPSVRVEAYGHLWEIEDQATDKTKLELVPILKNGLHDNDHLIRRAAASAAADGGALTADALSLDLIEIVGKLDEDDVTYFCTEALGNLNDRTAIQTAIPCLLKAAGTYPDQEKFENGPQLRRDALKALIKLSKYDWKDIDRALGSLEGTAKGEYLAEIKNERAILQTLKNGGKQP